ncbi:patatin-like phospholipase family protein [Marinobacter zhejiangensis]|uniref:NTE family protein n=1 Tax=Marinobacter zhejiangensis TaxID=488535 RepID=A0A1I4RSU1_9GAMM|nr:patatin-like phospholipase family protein [Marinobacter zhejiangensis]SFM55238.1 NTE family protein [Marinobacter zhejiangensis]
MTQSNSENEAHSEPAKANAGVPQKTAAVSGAVAASPERSGRRKTVALTLGSGGARGYAHIGAIEVLQEHGYDIIAVSGCSMGALIGGVFAAGKLKDYKDWVTGLGQFDVLKLLDVTFNSAGAIRGEKVFSVVREMLGDTRIEDLRIPYTAVATDLLSHKEVWFQEGPVDQAIRASIAIPGLIAPMVLQGRVLVDGALLNPLPIIPTISSHADLIVAINLAGEEDQVPTVQDAMFAGQDEPREGEEWAEKVLDKASRWFDWDILKAFTGKRDGSGGDSAETEARINRALEEKRAEQSQIAQDNGKGLLSELDALDWDKLGIGRFDVMNLAIESMQSALVQYKIAGYPPDLLVNVPKNICRTYDYHKAPELIQIGRERMERALERYEKRRSSSGPLAP